MSLALLLALLVGVISTYALTGAPDYELTGQGLVQPVADAAAIDAVPTHATLDAAVQRAGNTVSDEDEEEDDGADAYLDEDADDEEDEDDDEEDDDADFDDAERFLGDYDEEEEEDEEEDDEDDEDDDVLFADLDDEDDEDELMQLPVIHSGLFYHPLVGHYMVHPMVHHVVAPPLYYHSYFNPLPDDASYSPLVNPWVHTFGTGAEEPHHHKAEPEDELKKDFHGKPIEEEVAQDESKIEGIQFGKQKLAVGSKTDIKASKLERKKAKLLAEQQKLEAERKAIEGKDSETTSAAAAQTKSDLQDKLAAQLKNFSAQMKLGNGKIEDIQARIKALQESSNVLAKEDKDRLKDLQQVLADKQQAAVKLAKKARATAKAGEAAIAKKARDQAKLAKDEDKNKSAATIAADRAAIKADKREIARDVRKENRVNDRRAKVAASREGEIADRKAALERTRENERAKKKKLRKEARRLKEAKEEAERHSRTIMKREREIRKDQERMVKSQLKLARQEAKIVLQKEEAKQREERLKERQEQRVALEKKREKVRMEKKELAKKMELQEEKRRAERRLLRKQEKVAEKEEETKAEAKIRKEKREEKREERAAKRKEEKIDLKDTEKKIARIDAKRREVIKREKVAKKHKGEEKRVERLHKRAVRLNKREHKLNLEEAHLKKDLGIKIRPPAPWWMPLYPGMQGQYRPSSSDVGDDAAEDPVQRKKNHIGEGSATVPGAPKQYVFPTPVDTTEEKKAENPYPFGHPATAPFKGIPDSGNGGLINPILDPATAAKVAELNGQPLAAARLRKAAARLAAGAPLPPGSIAIHSAGLEDAAKAGVKFATAANAARVKGQAPPVNSASVVEAADMKEQKARGGPVVADPPAGGVNGNGIPQMAANPVQANRLNPGASTAGGAGVSQQQQAGGIVEGNGDQSGGWPKNLPNPFATKPLKKGDANPLIGLQNPLQPNHPLHAMNNPPMINAQGAAYAKDSNPTPHAYLIPPIVRPGYVVPSKVIHPGAVIRPIMPAQEEEQQQEEQEPEPIGIPKMEHMNDENDDGTHPHLVHPGFDSRTPEKEDEKAQAYGEQRAAEEA